MGTCCHGLYCRQYQQQCHWSTTNGNAPTSLIGCVCTLYAMHSGILAIWRLPIETAMSSSSASLIMYEKIWSLTTKEISYLSGLLHSPQSLLNIQCFYDILSSADNDEINMQQNLLILLECYMLWVLVCRVGGGDWNYDVGVWIMRVQIISYSSLITTAFH